MINKRKYYLLCIINLHDLINMDIPLKLIQIQEKNPVIIYDGDCPLCLRSVRFLLKIDKHKRFRFISGNKLQSLILNTERIDKSSESVLLVWKGQVYSKAKAGLEIVIILGFPFNLLILFQIIPLCLLDKVYLKFASKRKRWFKKDRICVLPEINHLDRFI
ncbi:MAG: DUF393 domain-containing protein [Bacteroidales bacterium]|nr:DUF393 domain-containing protein [Bacteroidales bacterium]